MSQALSELRDPVNQEALRLRMAALHGREDALLDPARFPRLLRQANDAEIADVRKVGDDDYEISGRRTGGLPSPAPAVPAAALPAGAATEPDGAIEAADPALEPASGGRDNGQRFGVRFRRGSRGALRAGEIPLVGVVQIDVPAEAAAAEAIPVEAVGVETAEPAGKSERKAAHPKRAPRKKKAASAATAPKPEKEKSGKSAAAEGDPDAPPAAPVKRSRSRARKKAE
jgi:hypothetical protein